jgi:hypothetical protein
MSFFHNNTLSVSSEPPNTPYSFILLLMIGEMHFKTTIRTLKGTIKQRMNSRCIETVRLFHINVSFVVQKTIELRIVLTMSLEGVSSNPFSSVIFKQTNEKDNTGEDNSALIFIRDTIQEKSLLGKIMKSEGSHVKISITVA